MSFDTKPIIKTIKVRCLLRKNVTRPDFSSPQCLITLILILYSWSPESCYPESWRCDFEVHCRDGSDELHCVCPDNSVSCGNNPNTGLVQCVNMTNVCDGTADCFNNLDEANCTSSCPFGYNRSVSRIASCVPMDLFAMDIYICVL